MHGGPIHIILIVLTLYLHLSSGSSDLSFYLPFCRSYYINGIGKVEYFPYLTRTHVHASQAPHRSRLAWQRIAPYFPIVMRHTLQCMHHLQVI